MNCSCYFPSFLIYRLYVHCRCTIMTQIAPTSNYLEQATFGFGVCFAHVSSPLKPAVGLTVTLLTTGVRHHSDISVVSSCLIHVYMPNLVCPSVRPVWPVQSLGLTHRFSVASLSAQVLTDSN